MKIKTWKTAIIVHLTGSKDRQRSDTGRISTALPVEEKTGLPFSSKHKGRMHACGHDIHMTVCLGILSYFAEHQPKCDMTFIFQPAEENASGGKQLYESGELDEWMPDEIYAFHDNPQLPAGAIGCCMGTLFAGTSRNSCQVHRKERTRCISASCKRYGRLRRSVRKSDSNDRQPQH